MSTTCRSCQSTSLERGATTETLKKKGIRLTVYGVPARTCAECGEVHISVQASDQIAAFFEEAQRKGVQVSIRRYRVEQPVR